MTTDTFLFNAGSLFFAAWIAIIVVVTLTAFGRDLLPRKAQPDPAPKTPPADHPPPTQPSPR